MIPRPFALPLALAALALGTVACGKSTTTTTPTVAPRTTLDVKELLRKYPSPSPTYTGPGLGKYYAPPTTSYAQGATEREQERRMDDLERQQDAADSRATCRANGGSYCP